MGDKVRYTGEGKTWDDGDKVVHGQLGEAKGVGVGECKGKGVVVFFPGNKYSVNCLFTEVRRLHCQPRLRLASTDAMLPTPRASALPDGLCPGALGPAARPVDQRPGGRGG